MRAWVGSHVRRADANFVAYIRGDIAIDGPYTAVAEKTISPVASAF